MNIVLVIHNKKEEDHSKALNSLYYCDKIYKVLQWSDRTGSSTNFTMWYQANSRLITVHVQQEHSSNTTMLFDFQIKKKVFLNTLPLYRATSIINYSYTDSVKWCFGSS